MCCNPCTGHTVLYNTALGYASVCPNYNSSTIAIAIAIRNVSLTGTHPACAENIFLASARPASETVLSLTMWQLMRLHLGSLHVTRLESTSPDAPHLQHKEGSSGWPSVE